MHLWCSRIIKWNSFRISFRNTFGVIFKFDENGKWQHGRTIFPYYGTNDPEKIRLQVKKPFWLKKELRKHRYVYLLGSKSERKKIMKNLKYPSLPYPKEKISTELEIIKMDPR